MTDRELPSLATVVGDEVVRAVATLVPQAGAVDPLVRPSAHADLQSNVAMALAKPARRRPAELAEQIAAALRANTGVFAAAEVSGPGFINITVTDAELWRRVEVRGHDGRLGVGHPRQDERTVIDYSSPNIAKDMHVGHLRSTVIGDCLVRVLDHLGSDVVRQNHLGDWGTQFGMLIQYLDEHPDQPWRARDLAGIDGVAGGDGSRGEDSTVSVLDELYRAARAQFDADPAFAERSRTRVVALQAGDRGTLATWREIVTESQGAFFALYHRLGILLTPADSAGESTYNPWLAEVIDELVADGIAVESQGALCVFDPEVTGPDGEPIPMILRKSDGGYGYDTTDLATLRYRIRDLKGDRLLYVVDARQSLHFRMLFDAGRRAGWITDGIDVRHVAFGTVLGPDGRPFKTRSGGTVRLGSLLEDAVGQARQVIAEKQPDLDEDELTGLAEVVGIGSVKYAELSTSRVKDYAFDVARMVSFTGDTGAYLQYAHARVNSILRRAAQQGGPDAPVEPEVEPRPAERALIRRLDTFGDVLAEVGQSLEPHRLCTYLYELAKAFTDFYEACPVLAAANPAERDNRLALCRLTAATLRQGLDLLGIQAPERL